MQNPGSGYIYMYTYEHLYKALMGENQTDLNWLKMDNSIIEGKKTPLKDWAVDGNILVKIGMTTKPVHARIAEWEQNCHHKIIILTPTRIYELLNVLQKRMDKPNHSQEEKKPNNPLRQLSKHFKKLSISDPKPHQLQQIQPPYLYTFKNDGFLCLPNTLVSLAHVEATIHQTLWIRYEKANMHCTGCMRAEKPTKHMEWFKIPIQDLIHVLYVIDINCLRTGKDRVRR